jgi:hypothetical protein
MDVEDVIILSGDHLYHMDYLKFVQVCSSSCCNPSSSSLSLSLYKMDALIWDSHPHNNNNSCVCGVCMELLFLHDGFEIRNLVIQSMMSLSLCFSLGYLQRSLLWDNWQHHTAILKLAETQGHRCRHHHLMCANGLQVYICTYAAHLPPAFQLWFQRQKNKPWDHKKLWGANFGCNLNGKQQGNTHWLMMLVPVLWMGVVQPCLRDAPVDEDWQQWAGYPLQWEAPARESVIYGMSVNLHISGQPVNGSMLYNMLHLKPDSRK